MWSQANQERKMFPEGRSGHSCPVLEVKYLKYIYIFKVVPLKVATWKSGVTLIRMVSVEVRD